MSEIHERHDVLTLDTDFTVYRKYGRYRFRLFTRRGNNRENSTASAPDALPIGN